MEDSDQLLRAVRVHPEPKHNNLAPGRPSPQPVLWAEALGGSWGRAALITSGAKVENFPTTLDCRRVNGIKEVPAEMPENKTRVILKDNTCF